MAARGTATDPWPPSAEGRRQTPGPPQPRDGVRPPQLLSAMGQRPPSATPWPWGGDRPPRRAPRPWDGDSPAGSPHPRGTDGPPDPLKL